MSASAQEATYPTELQKEVEDYLETLAFTDEATIAGLVEAMRYSLLAGGKRFRPVLVEAGEGGTVTFADGREVEADGVTPILDAAENAGVLMPSGCRMGICMGCVIPMKSGAVRDLRNGAITVAVPGETGPEGVKIQTCISAAAGACHVDEGARSR